MATRTPCVWLTEVQTDGAHQVLPAGGAIKFPGGVYGWNVLEYQVEDPGPCPSLALSDSQAVSSGRGEEPQEVASPSLSSPGQF